MKATVHQMQLGATAFGDEDPEKFVIGQLLEFLSYSEAELWDTLTEYEFADWQAGKRISGYDFEPGDILVVEERNGCGIGIDVWRVTDGTVDMVQPEEVRVYRDKEWDQDDT